MRFPVVPAVVLAALFLPGVSLAKGPDAATVSGPGLDDPVALTGYGESSGSTPLGQLVEAAGFFPQAFGQSPDPTTRVRPDGELGPAYRVVYRVPGSPGHPDTLVQTVYPYASPPVSHMAAGQRFFGSQRTIGGWIVATRGLKQALVRVGLPSSEPTRRGEDDGVLGVGAGWLLLGALGAGAVVAVAGTLLRTRRPGPASAT